MTMWLLRAMANGAYKVSRKPRNTAPHICWLSPLKNPRGFSPTECQLLMFVGFYLFIYLYYDIVLVQKDKTSKYEKSFW